MGIVADMEQVFFRRLCRAISVLAVGFAAQLAQAESSHGIAMYGDPALPPDFEALPYVNPFAPKGGAIRLGNAGSYDSLNPYIQKGTVPWQLRFFTHESLMHRSQDEPFTLYGLLAESVNVPEDRAWVEFTLRREAAFSDGTPVTVEDVIWSFETLGTEGHGRYRGLYSQIESIEETGPRSVRITFNTDNRELALLAGMRPILQKAQWAGKDFANARLEDIPVGSGPYVIESYEPGRSVTLRRDPDYWGARLPVRKGHHNFDEIRLEFYGDADILGEAFKAGEISAVREFNAAKWESQYNFPRAAAGDVIKTEITHQKPSGITGFVMNTRRPPFDDWRVRQALIEMFNFEYIAQTLTGGAQGQITSYFSNSPLAFEPGPATGEVRDLLAPFAADLLPGTLEGYEVPRGSERARDRAAIRRATDLLAEAGWRPGDDGKMRNGAGVALEFDILLTPAATEPRQIATIYSEALGNIGITARVAPIDSAQFTERTTRFDFDMAYYRRALSLSPGNEQRFYWGSESADSEGSRNWMGVQDPAVDAMIDTMLSTTNRDTFVAATRALDRLMTAGRYVVPFWEFAVGRIAHVKEMHYPERLPLYGDGPNYMPELWWWEG